MLASIPQGHYTVESLIKELAISLKENNNDAKLELKTNKPHSVLKVTRGNPTLQKQILFSHALASLIGTNIILGVLQ